LRRPNTEGNQFNGVAHAVGISIEGCQAIFWNYPPVADISRKSLSGLSVVVPAEVRAELPANFLGEIWLHKYYLIPKLLIKVHLADIPMQAHKGDGGVVLTIFILGDRRG